MLRYLIWIEHDKNMVYIKMFIFMTYQPIENLSNVMLLWQLLNTRVVTMQLRNKYNCLSWPKGDLVESRRVTGYDFR